MKYLLETCMLIIAMVTYTSARADDEQMMSESQMLLSYRQECGACHMAYPPAFLSKPAWGRVMHALSRHYGTDASMDPATASKITQWLNQYGGSYKRVAGSSKEDRLTTTPWFMHEHEEIARSIYQRAAIRSPANCAACHIGAGRGNFEEDFVRIPK